MEDARVEEFVTNARLEAPGPFRIFGRDPVFASTFRVGESAAVAHGLAASAAARFHALRTGDEQSVTVDIGPGAGTLLSYDYERVDGESLPPWNVPVTNSMYQCRAGDWIYLQGQLPHLHRGILELLGCGDDRREVATAVARWDAVELEDALADRRLCGARARRPEEWSKHPQGAYLDSVPTVDISRIGAGDSGVPVAGARPLSGVRVLEFARILAGPMTGRTLAEHGADVLSVSTPDLIDLFGTTTITGHGKRSTYLDFTKPEELAILQDLLSTCDVLVDGNRAGALSAHGLSPEELCAQHPGLIYVSVNCYGHGGPWSERRGWEQLAQMVSGLTIGQGSAEQPEIVPPGAPNDFITGILAAYGAMAALECRAVEGGSWHVKASLAQTAMWIVRNGVADPSHATGVGDLTELVTEDDGPLGRGRYLGPVARLGRTPARWARPSPVRGGDSPTWETV